MNTKEKTEAQILPVFFNILKSSFLNLHSNYFMAEQTHFDSLLRLKLGDLKGVHNIYSASMKSCQYRNFEKCIIQLFVYCYIHIYSQRHAGLER